MMLSERNTNANSDLFYPKSSIDYNKQSVDFSKMIGRDQIKNVRGGQHMNKILMSHPKSAKLFSSPDRKSTEKKFHINQIKFMNT